MGRRLIATMAALAIGTVGALAFASPGTAAPVAKATSVAFTGCTAPEQEVSKVQAENAVKAINPAACLDIQFVDKCDGTTVVTMTNWVFNDNKWTVLTVELAGKEYTLKGGSDPNTETVVLGPPGVEDVQAKLVFRFTTPDGEFQIKKNYGDPWTWEEPKGCVTPSPSPSVTPSVTPSATSTSTAPTTTSAPGVPTQNDAGGLPVTGASTTSIIVAAVVLLLTAGGALYLRRRRNGATTA